MQTPADTLARIEALESALADRLHEAPGPVGVVGASRRLPRPARLRAGELGEIRDRLSHPATAPKTDLGRADTLIRALERDVARIPAGAHRARDWRAAGAAAGWRVGVVLVLAAGVAAWRGLI